MSIAQAHKAIHELVTQRYIVTLHNGAMVECCKCDTVISYRYKHVNMMPVSQIKSISNVKYC